MTNTTWSPADCSRSITFSNGNRTITSAAAGDRGAHCGDPVTAGKLYIEFNFPALTNIDTGAGFCSDASGFANAGATAEQVAMVFKSGNIWICGTNTTKNVGALTNADTLCCAFDIPNALVWFRKNGGIWNADGAADPATGTGGIAVPFQTVSQVNINTGDFASPYVYALGLLGASGDSCTANFGDTSFAQTVPAGFTAGWPINPVTHVSALFPNDCRSGVISDAQNLTFTANTDNTYSGAAPHYSRSTGKYHVQFTVDTLVGSTYGVGLQTLDALYTNIGQNTNSIVYIGSSGIVKFNNATVTTLATYGTGDVIDMEFDLDNDEIWFRKNGGNWNGSPSANPATNTGGISIASLLKPLVPMWSETTRVANDAVTCGFGYLAFGHAVSAGFTAGWPITGPQLGPGGGGSNICVNV